VLEIRRLRSADGEPIALIETWLPLPLAESLTAAELTDASLHATLRRRFGIAIVSGRRQVRAVAATPTLAAALRVPEASPLLLLEGTSFDSAGAPIEVFRTWHRADRVIFDLDVVHDSGLESPAEAVPTVVSGVSAVSAVSAVPSVLAVATPQPKRAAQAERIRRLARELEELSAELDRE
jgi:GntR family transcriptional regulator